MSEQDEGPKLSGKQARQVARILKQDALVGELVAALEWYRATVAAFAKTGDKAAMAAEKMDKDGGKRARAAIAKATGEDL